MGDAPAKPALSCIAERTAHATVLAMMVYLSGRGLKASARPVPGDRVSLNALDTLRSGP
jgi:hypothetical protein